MIDLLNKIMAVSATYAFGGSIAAYYKGDTFLLIANALSLFLTVGFLFIMTEKKVRLDIPICPKNARRQAIGTQHDGTVG